MTNMYLKTADRRRSRAGCLAVAGLALLVLVAILLFVLNRRDRQPPADPDPAEAVETDAAATVVARPRVPDDDPGEDLLAKARAALKEDDLLEAREYGWRILDESSDKQVRDAAETMLGEVNITLVTTRRPMPEKEEYSIQSGDSLGVLARRFGTTIDLIRKSNNISGDIIHVGNRLRILNVDFSITVSITRNDLVLYMNDKFFKRYDVGTGEFASTPLGSYVIVDRIPRPVWWTDGRRIPYGHEDNLLGTHYLKLDVPGYGIHGTWEPETIGHQRSAGCVRLLNEDIEELYTLLPEGVDVVIEE